MSDDDSNPWGEWQDFVREDGISADERDRRESVVSQWMASPPSVDTVVREWWAFERGWESFEADQVREQARVFIAMYERKGIGLYLWRAYLEYRAHGLPVGEEVLRLLDDLASRQLSAKDEKQATLANLPLGTGRKPGGRKHMENLEWRRRVVERVALLLHVWPAIPKGEIYSQAAREMQNVKPGLTGDYVKKIWCDWLNDERIYREGIAPDSPVKALEDAMGKWR